jgi:hypothetical protein
MHASDAVLHLHGLARMLEVRRLSGMPPPQGSLRRMLELYV